MTKTKYTDVFNFEGAIRDHYNGKGVRFVYPNSYEAYISCHGKFLSCGTHPTEEKAKEVVKITRIKLFEANVIAQGDDPAEIKEISEKGYFASPKGNIYNIYGDLLKGAIDRCGYRYVNIKHKNRRVHRIIAETFLPNPKRLTCVNHKDGNKLNNTLDNLEWCTHSENTKHAYKSGLQSKVTNPHGTFHVLNEFDFDIIRDLHHRGYPDREIAKEIGCSRSIVSKKIREWGIRNDHD